MATINYFDGSVWSDAVHPIGSFYFSVESTSPATLFGGQWTQVTGAAIRGAEEMGYVGSDTHTLTTMEIPAHRHVNTRYWGVVCSQGMNTGNLNATYNNSGTGTLLYGATVLDWVGGVPRTQFFSGPSTVTSGIVQPRQRVGGVR